MHAMTMLWILWDKGGTQQKARPSRSMMAQCIACPGCRAVKQEWGDLSGVSPHAMPPRYPAAGIPSQPQQGTTQVPQNPLWHGLTSLSFCSLPAAATNKAPAWPSASIALKSELEALGGRRSKGWVCA